MSLREMTAREARDLCVDLTSDETPDEELCERYGLTQEALVTFAERHADVIAAMAAKITQGETVPPWIADKTLRLEDMARDVDDINAGIDCYRDPDGNLDPRFVTDRDYQNSLRVKDQIRRSAADEIDGTRRALVPPESERQQVRYMINTGLSEDLT
jgi:hypothetical protein